MNAVLWALQVILSVKSVASALAHLRHDQPAMRQGIEAIGSPAQPLLVVTAGAMALTAAGLVAPAVPGISGRITPMAAVALAVLMLLSITFHLNCREPPNVVVSIVLFALAALLAYGRWSLAPL